MIYKLIFALFILTTSIYARESGKEILAKIQILTPEFSIDEISACKRSLRRSKCIKELKSIQKQKTDELIAKIQKTDTEFKLDSISECGEPASTECINSLLNTYSSQYTTLLTQAEVLKIQPDAGCDGSRPECVEGLSKKVIAAVYKKAIQPWATRMGGPFRSNIRYNEFMQNKQAVIAECLKIDRKEEFSSCLERLREKWYIRWSKPIVYSIIPHFLRQDAHCTRVQIHNLASEDVALCNSTKNEEQLDTVDDSPLSTEEVTPPVEKKVDSKEDDIEEKVEPSTTKQFPREINEKANMYYQNGEYTFSSFPIKRTSYITYAFLPIMAYAGYAYMQYDSYNTKASNAVVNMASDFTMLSAMNASSAKLPSGSFFTLFLISSQNQEAYSAQADSALGQVQAAGGLMLLVHLINVVDVFWGDWNIFNKSFSYGKPLPKELAPQQDPVGEENTSFFINNEIISYAPFGSSFREEKYTIGLIKKF